MERNKLIEVIFSSRHSVTNLYQKRQVRWLKTTAQSVIELQNEKAKKLFIKSLKGSQAIYLS